MKEKLIDSVKTGNPFVDILIPEGIPRNSFILLNGEPGTGKGAFLSELVYRRLKLDEPIIYLAVSDSPLSILQRLYALGWDIIPFITKNKIKFLDCFSYRMLDKERPVLKMNIINEKIWKEVEDDIIPCEPKANLYNTLSSISSLLNKMNIVNTGVLVLDSLTEFATLHTQERALEFIKTLRARLCKERFIQIFAVNNIGIPQFEVFSSLLNYFSDGVIDFRFEPNFMKRGILIKQFRIRKLTGTDSKNIWLTFNIIDHEGLKVPQKIIDAVLESYDKFFTATAGAFVENEEEEEEKEEKID